MNKSQGRQNRQDEEPHGNLRHQKLLESGGDNSPHQWQAVFSCVSSVHWIVGGNQTLNQTFQGHNSICDSFCLYYFYVNFKFQNNILILIHTFILLFNPLSLFPWQFSSPVTGCVFIVSQNQMQVLTRSCSRRPMNNWQWRRAENFCTFSSMGP